jgi:hypothetical protein
MKLFKKLMAGAMAIAMLSVYTVAFAGSVVSGAVTSGGSTTVSGVGSYAGKSDAIFLVKLPTAAAASEALAFTVDPNETIKNSAPANALGGSDYGSVIFSTKSGSGAQYNDVSAPLKVISMSSVDVKVNMFASVSDTKMTLSTVSGFAADSTDHLYLGVQVYTVSGGTPTASGGALAITALGAKAANDLKTVSGNFKTVVSGGSVKTTVSGAGGSVTDLQAAEALDEDSWNAVQYTVIGASNPKADWQIPGIDAPTLTITWKIDPSNVTTYAIGDPPANNNYKSQLDKNAYTKGETATLWVKPTNSESKLTSAKLTYIAISTTDGTMKEEKTVPFSVVATPINGAYKATLTVPTDMARPTSPKGDINAYKAPTWEIEVG